MNDEKKEREQQQKADEKRQISALRSGHTGAARAALEEIRISGRVNMLPEIFEMLLETHNQELLKTGSALLNDLKAKDAGHYFIDALRDPRFQPIHKILVSACWQNGLEFKGALLTFADILISENYETAIEAYTVIENNLGNISDKDTLLLLDRLQKGETAAEEPKRSLISSMIAVVRNY